MTYIYNIYNKVVTFGNYFDVNSNSVVLSLCYDIFKGQDVPELLEMSFIVNLKTFFP